MTHQAIVWVATKADLSEPDLPVSALRVSVKTGAGIADLIAALEEAVAAALDRGHAAPLSRPRHRREVAAALAAIERAIAMAGQADLAAEDLRAAATALGRLTGRIDVEEVLDAIFSSFCIGK